MGFGMLLEATASSPAAPLLDSGVANAHAMQTQIHLGHHGIENAAHMADTINPKTRVLQIWARK